MFQLLLLAALGAAGFAVAKRKLPPGQGPFDTLPPGVDANDPVQVDTFEASSKRRYRVTSYSSAADGRVFSVAEKLGDVDWLSWWYEPRTGVRSLWGANADQAGEVDDMKRDLGVEQ